MRFPGDAERPEDEQLTQFERRDWSDAWSVRFGLEVRPPVAPGLALRAGVVYDTSPSPSDTVSPSLPDADRIDASGGVGYVFPWGLVVDVGYMYVRFLERTTTGDAFPGTYRASAHLLGMSVGYRYFD
jgi:long-chain fatty acid transport protein